MLWRPRLSGRSGVLLAAILILPSLIWVLRDQSVWSWDPASYAEHALHLNLELTHTPSQWAKDILYISGPHAPGIEWLGQLFLYLRNVTGTVERSLLLMTLLIQIATLALMWASVGALSSGSVMPRLTACLFVAAAPLFVGLSTRFLAEPLQGLSVCGFLYVASRSSRWHRLTTLTAILFWGSVAMLAKISSPAYCLAPAAVSAWQLVRPGGARLIHASAGKRIVSLGGLAVTIALVAVVVGWYRVNLQSVLEFAKASASGAQSVLYGRKAPLPDKLAVWLVSADRSFTRWNLWILPAFAAAGSALARLLRPSLDIKEADGLRPAAAVATAQVAFVLILVSLNVNEDPRFIYALLPYLGVLVAWLVSRVRPPAITLAFVGLLFAQYASVHAAALGVTRASLPWLDPVVTSRGQNAALAALVAKTATAESNARVVFIAVELPWLNHCSYRLEARRQSERTGFMPLSEGFGFVLLDAREAFDAIEREHPASVISYFDSRDPDLKSPLNKNVLGLLERFRSSPAFMEHGLEEDPRIRIFQSRSVHGESR